MAWELPCRMWSSLGICPQGRAPFGIWAPLNAPSSVLISLNPHIPWGMQWGWVANSKDAQKFYSLDLSMLGFSNELIPPKHFRVCLGEIHLDGLSGGHIAQPSDSQLHFYLILLNKRSLREFPKILMSCFICLIVCLVYWGDTHVHKCMEDRY